MTADLDRFTHAQDGTYDAALAELRGGRKTGHWMWFVFPQIAGLGRSSTAQLYAIHDMQEARDYLDHETLGPRLQKAAQAVLESGESDATRLLGEIDALKLRSSMTLFEAAADSDRGSNSNSTSKSKTDSDFDSDSGASQSARTQVYAQVLDTLYDGVRDPETLRRL